MSAGVASQSVKRPVLLAGVALALGVAALAPLSLGLGAAHIPLPQVFGALFDRELASALSPQQILIVLHIRLPRLALGLLVGACLGLAGALMQGLFRNPLADPGLVGVSSGAGLAAATAIVLGDRFSSLAPGIAPTAILPIAAFLGALAATSALYGLSTRQGRTSIATMLLAGVALAALSGALTGMLAYISDDRQLRDLTFWSMGSLGGASWSKAAPVALALLALASAAPFVARGLDALALGEAEAFHLGVGVQRLKAVIVFLAALAVGASVAAAGVIGFVGIVAPQALRLGVGPHHRALLPLSALAGALLLTLADALARSLAAPAEIPVGVLTAAVGAPFFLWLLIRRERELAE